MCASGLVLLCDANVGIGIQVLWCYMGLLSFHIVFGGGKNDVKFLETGFNFGGLWRSVFYLYCSAILFKEQFVICVIWICRYFCDIVKKEFSSCVNRWFSCFCDNAWDRSRSECPSSDSYSLVMNRIYCFQHVWFS